MEGLGPVWDGQSHKAVIILLVVLFRHRLFYILRFTVHEPGEILRVQLFFCSHV